MENMIGIAFTSSMTPGLSWESRNALVKKARIDNQKVEISSVLLYCDGSFMQYMEGPERHMQSVYSGIERDARHRGVIKIFQHDISEREFASSEMLYYESGDSHSNPTEVAASLEQKRSGSTPGRMVLRGFWVSNNFLRSQH